MFQRQSVGSSCSRWTTPSCECGWRQRLLFTRGVDDRHQVAHVVVIVAKTVDVNVPVSLSMGLGVSNDESLCLSNLRTPTCCIAGCWCHLHREGQAPSAPVRRLEVVRAPAASSTRSTSAISAQCMVRLLGSRHPAVAPASDACFVFCDKQRFKHKRRQDSEDQRFGFLHRCSPLALLSRTVTPVSLRWL